MRARLTRSCAAVRAGMSINFRTLARASYGGEIVSHALSLIICILARNRVRPRAAAHRAPRLRRRVPAAHTAPGTAMEPGDGAHVYSTVYRRRGARLRGSHSPHRVRPRQCCMSQGLLATRHDVAMHGSLSRWSGAGRCQRTTPVGAISVVGARVSSARHDADGPVRHRNLPELGRGCCNVPCRVHGHLIPA